MVGSKRKSLISGNEENDAKKRKTQEWSFNGIARVLEGDSTDTIHIYDNNEMEAIGSRVKEHLTSQELGARQATPQIELASEDRHVSTQDDSASGSTFEENWEHNVFTAFNYLNSTPTPSAPII